MTQNTFGLGPNCGLRKQVGKEWKSTKLSESTPLNVVRLVTRAQEACQARDSVTEVPSTEKDWGLGQRCGLHRRRKDKEWGKGAFTDNTPLHIIRDQEQCKQQRSKIQLITPGEPTVKKGKDDQFRSLRALHQRITQRAVRTSSAPIQPPSFIRTPHKVGEKETMLLSNVDCAKMGKLQAGSAGCYFDVTLVALLFRSLDFVTQYIVEAKTKKESLEQQIQSQLQTIQQSLQNPTHRPQTCVRIRSLFQRYVDNVGGFLSGGGKVDFRKTQMEPQDVILLLGKIFGVPNETKIRMETYASHAPVRRLQKEAVFVDRREEDQSWSLSVSVDQVLSAKTSALLPMLRTQVKVFEDKADYFRFRGEAFKYHTTVVRFVSAPFLWIRLARVSDNVKIKTKILPELKFPLLEGPSLFLLAIICHRGGTSGGHYVAYVNCGSSWWHYNDQLSTQWQLVGTWEQLLETKDEVQTNSSDFLYARPSAELETPYKELSLLPCNEELTQRDWEILGNPGTDFTDRIINCFLLRMNCETIRVLESYGTLASLVLPPGIKIVMIPRNVRNHHWVLVVWFVKEDVVQLWDSLVQDGTDEKSFLETQTSKKVIPVQVPKQTDKNACGAFVCAFGSFVYAHRARLPAFATEPSFNPLLTHFVGHNKEVLRHRIHKFLKRCCESGTAVFKS